MQKIKTVRYRAQNIGGDRAFCKLKYVVGQGFGLAQAAVSNFQNQAMNVGASGTVGGTALQAASVNGIMGNTPNLSTMASLYLKYRIRGIKVRLTYWQQTGDPVILFTNAASDTATLSDNSSQPVPNFVTPTISTTSEQRWARTRVCSGIAAQGGRPTTLTSYYSVNKVYGPDSVVKNDEDFTGELSPATPYWQTASTVQGRPTRTPWIQFGITTLSGSGAPAGGVTGILRVEQTVYVEFFGKRLLTE